MQGLSIRLLSLQLNRFQVSHNRFLVPPQPSHRIMVLGKNSQKPQFYMPNPISIKKKIIKK